MTDKSFKSDDRVGHLNTILAREGGNLSDPIFKSSNTRGGGGGGGEMLKFRVDRRITSMKKYHEVFDWERTFSLPYKITLNTKLREFQSKILHRICCSNI